jgi:galactan endo-beta-1,3-galactanase
MSPGAVVALSGGVALVLVAAQSACATWVNEANGSSFDSPSAFAVKWSYDYPWGTNHNGSAVMNATNITIANGVVTLTSSLTNHYEGASTDSPYLTIRYNSGTFYLNEYVTVSSEYPMWDISGQFKAPTVTGTWPAFWMTGVDSWPPESDFMEFKGCDCCGGNTYDGSWQTQVTTVSTAGTAWHTYRMVAQLENSTNVDFHYYIDGMMEAEQTATTFVGAPCYVIIDYQMEGSSGAPGPSYTTYTYVSNIVINREDVSAAGLGPLANGAYKMLARSTGQCVDVLSQNTATNSPVGQWPYNGGLNEQWMLTYLGSGQYSVIGRQSGRALSVASGATTNGAGVILTDYAESNYQKWALAAVSGGYYQLINAATGKALEVSGNSSADAAFIDQWAPASTTPPQFSVASVAGANLTLNCAAGVPGLGYYALASSNLGLPLSNWTVLASATADTHGNFSFTNAFSGGASPQFFELRLQPTNGAANQQWTFQSP